MGQDVIISGGGYTFIATYKAASYFSMAIPVSFKCINNNEHSSSGKANDPQDPNRTNPFENSESTHEDSKQSREFPAEDSEMHLDLAIEILEITPENICRETISQSYRRLAKQYHPDIFASIGIPQDVKEYASLRFEEINEAYSYLKRRFP